MSKYPASKPRALASALCALALAFVSLAPALRPAHARRQTVAPQESEQQKPARRPRRVGETKETRDSPPKETKETPAPTPARRDDAPSGRAGEEVDEDDVVKVETQLISVPTVVTDREGKPLTGLRAENFLVYEDGRQQKIENFATTEAPFEVALLLDTSGSTRADVGLIRRAARAFIDALRAGDRVAVVSFTTKEDGDSKLAAVEVMTHLTDDRDALKDAVEMIGTSAGTPFYDSLERIAADIFRDPPRDELRGRRALVALSDGIDSTSDSDFEEARERLRRAGVVCYFVQLNTEDYVEERLMQDCQDDGALRLSRRQLARYRRIFAPRLDAADFEDFCRMGQFERMDISRRLYQLGRQEMSALAKDTGGKTFPIADLTDARRAFRQVAEEIGTQYSLGYYSTNKARDGSFRAIRVQVRGVKDAQVRAREGYQVPRG